MKYIQDKDNSQTQVQTVTQLQQQNTASEPVQQQSQSFQQASLQLEKPKSKWGNAIKIVGALLLLSLVLFGYLIFQGFKDAPEVQGRVTSFLQLASNGDLDRAYALTSKEFRAATTKEDFIDAMTLFEAQYSGFQNQQQTGFVVKANAGQPTLYEYSGIIYYIDGDQGDLEAVLVKEDDDYKILGITVNVDIKRLQKFQQGTSNSVLGVSIEE